MATQHDIRGVLIQVQGARLLLPNATIAEVLSYAPPEVVPNAPEWLLGRIRWRGWELPLVAFARLSDMAQESGSLGSKVVVLKAIGGSAKMPYFAMLTQGFPRLVSVSRDALTADADAGDDEILPQGVRARVLLREDHALLPDLEHIETMLTQALQHAA